MVNMRIIWKAQLDLCKAIAEDIIKYNASKEICKYADGFAMIESPYGTRDGYCGNDYIRINFGEAYCYIDIDKNDKPIGNIKDIWWNNEDMGVKNYCTYDGTINDLEQMTTEELKKVFEFYGYINDCYEDEEGKENEYAKSLKYIPYK